MRSPQNGLPSLSPIGGVAIKFGQELEVMVIVAIEFLKQCVSLSLRPESVIQARCSHASSGDHRPSREMNYESRGSE
jgi:hypothetical protein